MRQVGDFCRRDVDLLAQTRSAHDGSWILLFATQRGGCDPTYNVSVSVNIMMNRHPTKSGEVQRAVGVRPGAVRADRSGQLRVRLGQARRQFRPRLIRRPIGKYPLLTARSNQGSAWLSAGTPGRVTDSGKGPQFRESNRNASACSYQPLGRQAFHVRQIPSGCIARRRSARSGPIRRAKWLESRVQLKPFALEGGPSVTEQT
jgi:hypothetical protein